MDHQSHLNQIIRDIIIGDGRGELRSAQTVELSNLLAPLVSGHTLYLPHIQMTLPRMGLIKDLLTLSPFSYTISTISFVNSGLGDAHLKLLSQALTCTSMPNLSQMCLSDNDIGKDGVHLLIDSIGKDLNPRFSVLDLSNNCIEDDGLVKAAELLSLESFRALMVSNCGITDVGTDALAAAFHSPNFHRLVRDRLRKSLHVRKMYGPEATTAPHEVVQQVGPVINRNVAYIDLSQNEGVSARVVHNLKTQADRIDGLELKMDDPGDTVPPMEMVANAVSGSAPSDRSRRMSTVLVSRFNASGRRVS